MGQRLGPAGSGQSVMVPDLRVLRLPFNVSDAAWFFNLQTQNKIEAHHCQGRSRELRDGSGEGPDRGDSVTGEECRGEEGAKPIG